MCRWRIYYVGGSVVTGKNKTDWLAAPEDGVQVVVLMAPPAVDNRRWSHPDIGSIEDRQLWTGTDTYDPFGWGVKHGSWVPRAEYDMIWERACGDD